MTDFHLPAKRKQVILSNNGAAIMTLKIIQSCHYDIVTNFPIIL